MKKRCTSLASQIALIVPLTLTLFLSHTVHATTITADFDGIYPVGVEASENQKQNVNNVKFINLPDPRSFSIEDIDSITVDFNARVSSGIEGYLVGNPRGTSSRTVTTLKPGECFLGLCGNPYYGTDYEHSASIEGSVSFSNEFTLRAESGSFLDQLFGPLLFTNYTGGPTRPVYGYYNSRSIDFEATGTTLSDEADPRLVNVPVAGRIEWYESQTFAFSRTFDSDFISQILQSTPDIFDSLSPGVLSTIYLDQSIKLRSTEGDFRDLSVGASLGQYALGITYNAKQTGSVCVEKDELGRCLDANGCVLDFVPGVGYSCYRYTPPEPVPNVPPLATVPVPGSISLVVLGLAGVVASRRKLT